MVYKGINQEYIELQELNKTQNVSFNLTLSCPLVFVWIKGDDSKITYLGETIKLRKNTIVCITVSQQLELHSFKNARIIKFNKEFYCVLHHDSEVSCKGILFYNVDQIPYFEVPDSELEKFETLWKMFEIEMNSKDELQLEMLQMMLKRFIILATRVYKEQNNYFQLDDNATNVIREFNFLVEQYFKQKHSVKEYADLLHKSPKTLSNVFNKLSGETPLQIIHKRISLEAKRLLRYTDNSIKEIAYEVGFEDIQSFSRFFKKIEKMSPSEYKKMPLGNIANS